MASSHNVELEAAKFLHKLIQDSKDEPSKLATKLYVILQHMKASGKEHSMPYQVISRAMETVINQHSLDIEALKSSRLPLPSGSQVGNSATTQFAGPSQAVGVSIDSKAGLAENEMSKIDQFTSGRPPVGPSSGGHNYYQGAGSHRSGQAFDHESPSSLDTRSANSQSQERHDATNWDKQANQKDGRKVTSKRKRGDSSLPSEPQSEHLQQFDARATLVTRKAKMNKVEMQGSFPVKGGENSSSNMVPSGGQIEQLPSLSGGMRSMLRAKQEGQTQNAENAMDSVDFSNSMSRAPNPEYPEEVEVSSTHNVSGLQQGVSIPSTHEVLSSRGVWNQSKAGSSQVPRFSSNVLSGNMPENPLPQPGVPSVVSSAYGKAHGGMHTTSSSYLTREVGFSGPIHFSGSGSVDSEYSKHGIMKGAITSPFEKSVEPQFSANQGDEASRIVSTGRVLEHDGGNPGMLADASRIAQGGRQASVSGIAMPRTTAGPRDAGKSVSQAPTFSNMPFKEQQLKQLRAQCLVFLAFRNGLMPKKLHLEIALGNIFPKEGKGQSPAEPSSLPEVSVPFARPNSARETDRNPPVIVSARQFPDADSLKEAENSKAVEEKPSLPLKKLETDLQSPEAMERQTFLARVAQQSDPTGTRVDSSVRNPADDIDNGQPQFGRANHPSSVIGANKPMNSEMICWTGIASHNEVSRVLPSASTVQHELQTERKDTASSQFQGPGNPSVLGNQHAENHLSSFSLREPWKAVSGIDNGHHTVFQMRDTSMMSKHLSQDDPKFSMEQDGEDKSVYADPAPSPKYTMSEKWIVDQQKKKFLVEQNWLQKQQKAKRRISATFEKLKVNVSSSEDISAKTKSVIELKKLQLLELQCRLRSDFLNDFFKPIASDMERLKSYKKHKHGRRIKQLEKFEQKMKEERQKRIRERQKEFFGEIEVHKERLEDVFKIKRERWKGFNKYVKEFHKRKERFHREKIDRIQREKINLLKINDVEGYLRMVQDAKSDRVKQLLKETEKYLQKLGSKLQEAKGDEVRMTSIVEKNESAVDNDDESDQAKHYMESNEKYYMMAHSIKESIVEQPTCLRGGKLREYQMNGLRWLVSLYNNHLNGILADEMGLGKTVQVISLICYLMETKNDRGPFLVVVPSSVLSGWESEINFWAPVVHKIVYAGPPEERRRLFKEQIVHQKFNVLLTTYEYLMNKHDRPKLSKLHWHYIIIDEGHRIKNASCKLNADLKHYRSSHRLLLTGTPLQNNLEELWALLNFLLPNIFNSSEDFSQWFNKPFESNGDNSPDQALLSEEENLLIINRLHQVLRPFVLRRLKHKVENQLPEKIERLIRCEASAYQKLLMKRVEENLGSIGSSKARSVHNSVMELRNICNHPYLSQVHADEVDNLIPKHYLPPIVRLCGKLEMLDRLLPKLKATDHRVLFFSTMTRLLDIMEEYLSLKQYRYLRLDGHTSGQERGALIEMFNQQDSPYFIFLLSIRAGGVGVNLQAADTVIIFDTDWNPQVDLQAQARAHRIGQKRDVLVLRFETVQTVEEQVRASAEHKLGVANQSITAGFFDNNTSAEDRREYLEALLRECKKEEAAPVLDDDALNDILARSESEIDVFESVDKRRREEDLATWKKLALVHGMGSENLPPLPSRLVTDDDLKEFYEAMKLYDAPKVEVASNVGLKRKGESLGGLDIQLYGRGKRAREVRSYEEQWTEEEFEKMCQVDSPDSPKVKEELREKKLPTESTGSVAAVASVGSKESPVPPPALPLPSAGPPQPSKEETPPSKRGRGRPRRTTLDKSPTTVVVPPSSGNGRLDTSMQKGSLTSSPMMSTTDSLTGSATAKAANGAGLQASFEVSPSSQPTASSPSVPPGFGTPDLQLTSGSPSVPMQSRGQGRKTQSGGLALRRRGKKQGLTLTAGPDGLAGHDLKLNEQSQNKATNPVESRAIAVSGTVSGISEVQSSESFQPLTASSAGEGISGTMGIALNSQLNTPLPSVASIPQSNTPLPALPAQLKGQGRKTQSGVGTPRRRGKKQALVALATPNESNPQLQDHSGDSLVGNGTAIRTKQDNDAQELSNIIQDQACKGQASASVVSQDKRTNEQSDYAMPHKLPTSSLAAHDGTSISQGTNSIQVQSADRHVPGSGAGKVCPEAKPVELQGEGGVALTASVSSKVSIEVDNSKSSENKAHSAVSILNPGSTVVGPLTDSEPGSATGEGVSKTMHHVAVEIDPGPQSISLSVAPGSQATAPCPPEPIQSKRQGRKTAARAEAPRRRGKKQGPVEPLVSDCSPSQDLKLNSQSQIKGSKAITLRSRQQTDTRELATQHASEVHSPGVLSGQDLKRKETFANPAFGRIQTADINDVARVMKEIFSETCSSKAKIDEASANEGKDASSVPIASKTSSDTSKEQKSEDKTIIAVPASETTAQILDFPGAKQEKQSGIEDANAAKGSGPILGESHVSRTDYLEQRSETTALSIGSSTDPASLSNENSIIESNMTQNTFGKKSEPSASGDCPAVKPSISSEVEFPGVGKCISLDKIEPSLKETARSPFVVCGLEASSVHIKVAGDGDNSRVSGTNSGNTKELSSKDSLEIPLGSKSNEAPTTSHDVVDVRGHSQEAAANLFCPGHSVDPSTPGLSGMVDSCGMAETNLRDTAVPPLKESLETLHDNRSVEGSTIAIKADDIDNQPEETEPNSASLDDSGLVVPPDLPSTEAKAAECSTQTIDAGQEISKRTTDHASALELDDVAPGPSTGTSHKAFCESSFAASSSRAEDKKDALLESAHSVNTDSSNIQLVSDNHGEVQLPSGIGSLNDEMHCKSAVKVSSEETSKMEHVEEQPCRTEMQLGEESTKNDDGVVCNTVVTQSEAQSSLPRDIPVELANEELVAEDHPEIQMEPRAENVEGDCAGTCNMEIDTSGSQASSLEILTDSSKQVASSAVKEDEMIDGISDKVSFGSTVVLKEPKESEADVGDQMDMSQVGGIVSEVASENMVLPCTPDTGKGNVGCSSNRSPDGSTIAPEGFTEACDQMGLSQADVVVPENTLENIVPPSSSSVAEDIKIEGLSERNPSCGLGELKESKESKSDIHEIIVESKAAGTAVKNETENIVLPSSSLATGQEMLDGSLDKSPVSSSPVQDQSKLFGAELGDRTDVSEGCGTMLENTSENMALLLSSPATEEMKVDVTSKKDSAGWSDGQQEWKRLEVEVAHQIDGSSESGALPEHKSENIDVPLSSVAMAEENMKGLSEKSPHGSLVEPHVSTRLEAELGDQADVSPTHQDSGLLAMRDPTGPVPVVRVSPYVPQVGEGVQENVHMAEPSASLAMDGKKIKDSSEEDLVGSLVADRDSTGSEAAVGNVTNIPQVGEVVPENVDVAETPTSLARGVCNLVAVNDSIGSKAAGADSLDVPQVDGVVQENVDVAETFTSLATAKEIDSSSQKDQVGSLVGVKDSTGFEATVGNQLAVKDSTENAELTEPSNLMAMEEKNIEDLSEKDSASSLVAVKDSTCTEADVGDPEHAPHVGGVVQEDVEIAEPPISMAMEEKKMEVSTCTEADVGDSEHAPHVGGAVQEDVEIAEPPTSLAVEEKKMEDLGGSSGVASLVAAVDLKGLETKVGDPMDVPLADKDVEDASENTGRPSSSLEITESKIEDLSEKDSIGGSVALNDELAETESGNPVDIPEASEVVRQNVYEEKPRPSSSLQTDEIEIKLDDDTKASEAKVPPTVTEEGKVEEASVTDSELKIEEESKGDIADLL